MQVLHSKIDAVLDGIIATYKSTQHSNTGVSPAKLIIGRRFKILLIQLSKVKSRRKVYYFRRVDAKSETAQQKSKQRYDVKH